MPKHVHNYTVHFENTFENPKGTLLTLVNWTNDERLGNLQVTLQLPVAPKQVLSVTNQKPLAFEHVNGTLEFTTDLGPADFIQVLK